MAQEIHRLTTAFVRNVKKKGLYHDGDGLYLQVTVSKTQLVA